jgi:predicted metal-binding protein
VDDHDWFPYHDMTVCKSCGIVKRRTGENKPCPGKVRVALRDQPQTPQPVLPTSGDPSTPFAG